MGDSLANKVPEEKCHEGPHDAAPGLQLHQGHRREGWGTLDDPKLFGSPQMAIYTIDKQPFHQVPEGLPTFERMPQR